MADIPMVHANVPWQQPVRDALDRVNRQLQQLKDASSGATEALQQAHADYGRPEQPPHDLIIQAKQRTVHASYALLTNLQPLKDRATRLQAILDKDGGEVDGDEIQQLVDHVPLAPRKDFPFMNHNTRYPRVKYESDPADTPPTDLDSLPNDMPKDGLVDKVMTTHRRVRSPKKRKTQNSRKTDLYGDTDTGTEDESEDNDASDSIAAPTKVKSVKSNASKKASQTQKSMPRDKDANPSSGGNASYPRDPSNPFRGANGEPIWIRKTSDGVAWSYLIACPVVVDLGPEAPENERYANMHCPTCKGNFSPGKSDFALGYDGLKNHCKHITKVNHTIQACIERFLTSGEIDRIVDNDSNLIQMSWLVAPGGKRQLPAVIRRADKFSANDCYEEAVNKEWTKLSEEAKDSLRTAAADAAKKTVNEAGQKTCEQTNVTADKASDDATDMPTTDQTKKRKASSSPEGERKSKRIAANDDYAMSQ